jgi:hypothetical protein
MRHIETRCTRADALIERLDEVGTTPVNSAARRVFAIARRSSQGRRRRA